MEFLFLVLYSNYQLQEKENQRLHIKIHCDHPQRPFTPIYSRMAWLWFGPTYSTTTTTIFFVYTQGVHFCRWRVDLTTITIWCVYGVSCKVFVGWLPLVNQLPYFGHEVLFRHMSNSFYKQNVTNDIKRQPSAPPSNTPCIVVYELWKVVVLVGMGVPYPNFTQKESQRK